MLLQFVSYMTFYIDSNFQNYGLFAPRSVICGPCASRYYSKSKKLASIHPRLTTHL